MYCQNPQFSAWNGIYIIKLLNDAMIEDEKKGGICGHVNHVNVQLLIKDLVSVLVLEIWTFLISTWCFAIDSFQRKYTIVQHVQYDNSSLFEA